MPQLAYKATSSVCRGRLSAFVQALDQKLEDIEVSQGSGGRDSVTGEDEVARGGRTKGAFNIFV